MFEENEQQQEQTNHMFQDPSIILRQDDYTCTWLKKNYMHNATLNALNPGLHLLHLLSLNPNSICKIIVDHLFGNHMTHECTCNLNHFRIRVDLPVGNRCSNLTGCTIEIRFSWNKLNLFHILSLN